MKKYLTVLGVVALFLLFVIVTSHQVQRCMKDTGKSQFECEMLVMPPENTIRVRQ